MELKEKKKIRQRVSSDCHPDKLAVAHGLCRNCYSKQLRSKNPEYAEKQRINCRKWSEVNKDSKTLSTLNYHLRKRYGITLQEYNEMYEK